MTRWHVLVLASAGLEDQQKWKQKYLGDKAAKFRESKSLPAIEVIREGSVQRRCAPVICIVWRQSRLTHRALTAPAGSGVFTE